MFQISFVDDFENWGAQLTYTECSKVRPNMGRIVEAQKNNNFHFGQFFCKIMFTLLKLDNRLFINFFPLELRKIKFHNTLKLHYLNWKLSWNMVI